MKTQKRIPESTWREALLAHSAGASLRELARHMGVSENTVMSRARRQKWTKQIEAARTLAPQPAVMPLQALGEIMTKDRDAFQLGAAKALARAASAAGELEPAEALERSRNVADIIGAGCKLHGIGGEKGAQVSVNVLNAKLDW